MSLAVQVALGLLNLYLSATEVAKIIDVIPTTQSDICGMPNQLSPASFSIRVFKILGLVKNHGFGYVVKTLAVYLKQWIHGTLIESDCISNHRYANWIRTNEQSQLIMYHDVREIRKKPKLVVIILIDHESIHGLGKTIQSLNNQLYDQFETICICTDNSSGYHEVQNKHTIVSKNPVCFLEDQGFATFFKGCSGGLVGEFVLFINASDVMPCNALFEIAKVLSESPHVKYVYSDEDTLDANGVRACPFFKPDWSPDLLMSFPYTGSLSAFAWDQLLQVCSATTDLDSLNLYDLTLRFTECLEEHEIFHIPKVLVHRSATATEAEKHLQFFDAGPSEAHRRALVESLGRRGIQGEVVDGHRRGTFRVRRKPTGNPAVSIIIPTRNRLSLLRNCIESIESKTTYRNYEILVVDNLSSDARILEYFQSFGHRVIRYEEPFNFSRLNNYAVGFAEGEVLLFLNNDVEVIAPEWIDAMLEHGLRKEVGAVGCKLIYPNGSIQHAGIVLGMDPDGSRAVAGHVFKRLKPGEMGYFGLAHVVRNLSAVTAAAMMTRKAVFEEVGGFDGGLGVSFNDVDLCLRLRQAGYLVVYTPYAELYHHESATRTPGANPAETRAMFDKWGGILGRDPYYNPNLSLRSFMCDLAL